MNTTGNPTQTTHHGRPITEVTTEDLIIDAVRYKSDAARAELARRGIDWTTYRWCA